jgi:hypothetical protein
VTYGTASNPHAHKSGRNRILSHTDIKFISALVDQRHCIYLNKIRQALTEQRGCVVSIATLSRTLRRLDIRSKSVSIRPLERNDLLRAAYMNRIADIVTNLDQFMFVDEAARNRRTSGHRKGWAFVGSGVFNVGFLSVGKGFPSFQSSPSMASSLTTSSLAPSLLIDSSNSFGNLSFP